MEHIIDLRSHLELIPQYVELRNRYCHLLLTRPVEVTETHQWLLESSTVIRLVEEDSVVQGVVLLYPQRDGEVAFFTRNPRKGMGTRLLGIVEKLALEAQLPAVWAWVREDNPIAGRVFEKCGYQALGEEARVYQSGVVNGTRYVRYLTS